MVTAGKFCAMGKKNKLMTTDKNEDQRNYRLVSLTRLPGKIRKQIIPNTFPITLRKIRLLRLVNINFKK